MPTHKCEWCNEQIEDEDETLCFDCSYEAMSGAEREEMSDSEEEE